MQAPEFFAHTTQEAASCRPNVILVGDNLGDANMALGLDLPSPLQPNVLKIGILLDKVDARLGQFKQAFDVVLLNEPDYSFLHKLVEEIITSGGGSNGSNGSSSSSSSSSNGNGTAANGTATKAAASSS